MHLTLHLTNRCNLKCKYCFVKPGNERMTREVAFQAIKFGMEDNKPSGLLFYGGEPLLEKELIYDIVAHTQKIKEDTGHIFYYKITTNGTLLDEEFLQFSKEIDMSIGFSHDGPAQDDNRLFHNGDGSFDILEEKIPLLLKYQPYAVGMSVVDPMTVHKAASTIQFLYDKGFRYITMNINDDPEAKWTKKHIDVLEQEYKKMAEMYLEWTRREEKFYLSPFDRKIMSHLEGDKYNENRRLMNRAQPSVAPDGKLYACSMYVNYPKSSIGDVFTGIDEEKRKLLEGKDTVAPESCRECAIKSRCHYAEDSLTRHDMDLCISISPVQCAHEQLLTPIADDVAVKLYREQNALFIHKHYNQMYSVVSLLEDRGKNYVM